MKLQNRMLLAQLPALVVIGVLVVWGGRTVSRLGDEGDRILAENYRSVLAAERMKESIERLDSAAFFRVAGEDGRADALVSVHRRQFADELAVEEANITESGEREAAAGLRTAWDQYEATYARFLALPPEARRSAYFDELLPAFEAVHKAAGAVLALNQDAMVRKSDAARESAASARRAWLGWAVVGLLAATALGVTLAHRLAEPLRGLSGAARRIGEGELELRLPTTRVEELDALAEAFHAMANRLRLYRRANDSELARARESAQAAIESLVDPVLVLTPRAELRATNGAARRLLDLTPQDRRLAGRDARLVGAIEDASGAVLESGRPVSPGDFTGVVVVEHDGRELALLPHATPINDTVTGELVGVTVLLQDVTRLRRLDELKGNLVQTVAHELRTPLTSLGMALHLALDERVSGPVDPRLGELLLTAREDVARLRGLVEDLLDLSRIQEGRVVLHREPVAPAELLGDVREAARAAARDAGVELILGAAEGLPEVALDRARMAVALTNLVVNAVHHAPAGSVVRLRALRAGTGVRFEVEDAGPGVPAADRERIFEAFERGADARGPGAGLGLSIAREVVRAHGGRIGVEAVTPTGACFWVEV